MTINFQMDKYVLVVQTIYYGQWIIAIRLQMIAEPNSGQSSRSLVINKI